ncbi:MAG: sulfatase [Verrucomicrobia bacterium]|nr:sulfatase [Verrucomicrobiota bacterium]
MSTTTNASSFVRKHYGDEINPVASGVRSTKRKKYYARFLRRFLSIVFSVCLIFVFIDSVQSAESRFGGLELDKITGATPRNIIFILSDDHRYDAMSFLGHPFIETPAMDSMAEAGVHFKNAFVTTSLCSPSRASILTGLYAHRHGVVDNNNPVSKELMFFPQYLQRAGYQTAFVGKWHMGGASDEPRRGFDYWVSFRGQGSYTPHGNKLNVNGERVPQKGYITDELTDYALDWLKNRNREKPFFLYLSHKAVHARFVPAERHKGKYEDVKFNPPASMANTPENYRGKPMWVKNQRNSWHGVDFPYHSDLDVGEYFKDYAETLLALDESVGKVLEYLKENGLFDSTLVVYMGDNGFMFGEHGLIDKRAAYETSIRVPMLAQCPELLPAGSTVEEVVANIDIAPTVLEAAGLKPPAFMDGISFFKIAQAKDVPWRDYLLYEYYWERNFPQTPTVHALRGDRFKYMRYHGLWDTDELYDIINDPNEMHNLIRNADYEEIARKMNRRLFEILEETGGMKIPLRPDRGGQANKRTRDGSKKAGFPDCYFID